MASSSTRLTAALLTTALIAGFSVSTHAAFEWRGPLVPPEMPAPPAQVEAPAAASPVVDGMGGLEPVIMWDKIQAPVPAMPAVPAANVEASPVVQPSVAVDPADMLSGFGSELPLVIALRQVVPAEYQMSFSTGVNPGTVVSWQGGKAWQDVLSDMLAPHVLSWRVEGQTVIVGYFEPAPHVQEQAAVMPAAPVPQQSPAPMRDVENVEAVPLTPPQPVPAQVVQGSPGKTQDATMTPGRRILLGRASPVGVQVSASAQQQEQQQLQKQLQQVEMQEPVHIRRTRPSSLLERWGLVKPKDADPAVTVSGPVDAVADDATDPVAPPVSLTAPEGVAAQGEASLEGQGEDAAVDLDASEMETKTSSSSADSQWQGGEGQTLRALLEEWSDTANVELYWSIDYDYRLDQDIALSGTYDEAVSAVLDRFSDARPQPYGQLHNSGADKRVLVVKSYDISG
ncbi:MAG: TcpQ domain-containing protein [Alphaproteobacteria bacterium]|nr:TcpQ domain-containing protein [Alphaproteobacteria bacterium]